MEKIIDKDLNELFVSIQNNQRKENIYALLEFLNYAKSEGYFSKEYFQYWLLKIISLESREGLFILCVEELIKNIFEFNPKEFGSFLTKTINLSKEINNFEKAIVIINYGLQGGAIFEKAWLLNILEYFGVNDLSECVALNNKNEALYLNKVLS